MKSLRTALLIGLFAALTVMGRPAAGLAQEAPANPRTARPSVSGLARGTQWTNRGQAYAVLPEVRAVLGARQGEPESAAFARAGVAGGPVLERKGGFLLFKHTSGPRVSGGTAGGSASAMLAGPGDPRPVVLNLRTNQLAVVVGTLRAELKDIETASAVSADLGITLGRAFASHRVAFFTAPPGTDLLALLGRLRADPRVSSADLELIEYVRTPQ